MFKLSDINDYANWDSPKIISLIIQYADEKDVEKLIANCFKTINLGPYEMCKHIDVDKPFKEYLIHLLTYENYPDAEFEKNHLLTKLTKLF